jgi:hypothetical protein
MNAAIKNCAIIVAMLVISLTGVCQKQDQVQWSFESRKKSDNTYEVVLRATIDKPWHIYSQLTPDGGPLATQIKFASNPITVIEGSAKEVGKLLTHHDKNFGVDVKYFSDDVEFVQTIKRKGTIKTSVRGSIEYMICDDTKCLPPVKKPFTIEIL